MSAKPRPAAPCCGLGFSPSDPRQRPDEGKVCAHAERPLNMVHAYCQIRDSWIGWVRGRARRNTIQRIVSELRALQQTEERVVNKPSVTLLAVLDYAGRTRKAVPRYTPRGKIDSPQPPVSKETRDACELMSAEAKDAERQRRLREWWAQNPSAPLLDVPHCLRADLPRILLRQLTPEGADPLTGVSELRESRALDGLGLPLAVEARLLAALDYGPHHFTVQLDWHAATAEELHAATLDGSTVVRYPDPSAPAHVTRQAAPPVW